jgi:integrase
MSRAASAFRIGKVRAYRRNKVWYLCYHECGKRHRPRVGPDASAARQLAAQVNAQLAVGSPAALSFQPITITDLRTRWLEHHEHVLRSSLHTIDRYRTATEHLLRYLDRHPVRCASHFYLREAEAFVRYLRELEVSPNGHPNTAKRPLLDKGIKYVLECCRALFTFAAKRRHLSPYADNPFSVLEVDRIPVDRARPVHLLTADQERAFLEACDDWQFPLFLTLLLTGLRSGEACHLFLPDDLDLDEMVIRVRNKPNLGWQVKSRNERDVPLVPELAAVLRAHLRGRRRGPVFRRRRWVEAKCPFADWSAEGVAMEVERRVEAHGAVAGRPASRADRARLARRVWRDLGALQEDRVRTEFIRVTACIGLRQ